MNEAPEFQAVASFAHRFEAELAVSQLDAAGIQAFVSGPDAGGTLLAIPGGMRVLVRHQDAEEATAILAETAAQNTSKPPRQSSLVGWLGLAFAVVVLA